jgi:chromosome segregation ATPase
VLQANGRVQALESEHETLIQNSAAMKDQIGQLMVERDEERAANTQSQMSLAQLLGEFSSSVSSAEEAAVALTASEELSESIASVLSGLDFALAQAKIHASQATQAHGNEQLRVVRLEMDLEEQVKAAADAAEECTRLSSIVKQLEAEKEVLESKVGWLF